MWQIQKKKNDKNNKRSLIFADNKIQKDVSYYFFRRFIHNVKK